MGFDWNFLFWTIVHRYTFLLCCPPSSLISRKFSKTIGILQGDIDALESEKLGLEQRLSDQTKKTILSDVTGRTLGGRGSPYSGSPYGSPYGSPFVGRRGSGGVGAGGSVRVAGGPPEPAGGATEVVVQESPLLLSKVCRVWIFYL